MFRKSCGVVSRRFASTSSTLKKPQYDFKSLRSNPEIYQDSIDRREAKLPGGRQLKDVLESYGDLIHAQKTRNELVYERNQMQKGLEQAAKDKIKDDMEFFRERLTDLKMDIKLEEARATELEKPVMNAIDTIPNLISPDVGLEEQELEILNSNNKKSKDDKLDHFDIATKFNLVDFESAARVSGSSWYYLTNDGALLEQALVQYGLSKARQHGFQMITPPSIVRQEITDACGFKPRDQNNEQQVYTLEDSNLCLTGTAEIPLAGWAAHKTLEINDNEPIKKVGVSRSYRAEAGARGKDTKGLYRVHEFTKVELFAWTRGNVEQSSPMLDSLLSLQKEIINELGLCARVLNMPANDLGAPAYKKYDIEAWMPGRGGYGEVTSASNCLDYQSRRMHTKHSLKDGSSAFAHTLNGTAIAVPRLIVAILENNYDPVNDRIAIPKVLQKWMDDKEYIERA